MCCAIVGDVCKYAQNWSKQKTDRTCVLSSEFSPFYILSPKKKRFEDASGSRVDSISRLEVQDQDDGSTDGIKEEQKIAVVKDWKIC